MEKNVKTSLSKYLSTCGIASRRKSCEFIRQGRVLVNGKTNNEPGFKISPDDEIIFDGRKVVSHSRIYVMLNKPRGYICTSDDPHASKKAIDLIELPVEQKNVRLFSAGRLDKDSEGLLIFTNDGDYAEKIMHPRYEIQKEYKVKIDSEITDAKLDELRAGITDDNEFLRPEKIIRDGKCRYTFVLNEGKKREIRRMVKHAGAKTLSLKRVSLGKLELGDLKTGQWKYLSPEEILKTLN